MMSRPPPLLSMGLPTPNPIQDPVALMNTYRSYVSMIVEPGVKDESKLKALQEVSQEFESIVGNPQYPSFLDHMLKVFTRILQDGEPHFIAEHTVHQMRKLILEIIHRIPTNQTFLPHVKNILSLMFKLLEIENEENILVVLRIIIEFHKTFRPPYNPEISQFLQYVKNIYKELPNHLDHIFDPRSVVKLKDITLPTLEPILNETFAMITVQCDKRGSDATEQFNLIPKATKSLKALAELPIIVVLMYQLYKQNVHSDVQEFIPLIMGTISLQPTLQQRNNPNFNKEVFVDFMAAQIKTLSFLAYIVRIYQSVVNEHSAQLAKGMIGLLRLCPQEVAHLRKELLIAARHILATELRDKFVTSLAELFDEEVLIGTGWTAYESLRPLAYSTLADLVHHIRQHLPLKVLSKAVNVFSKNVHDESLVTTIQTMSCKLLLNLVECIRIRSDRENGNGRELLMRLLEILVIKLKTIAKLQLPVLILKTRQQQQQISVSGLHLGMLPSPQVVVPPSPQILRPMGSAAPPPSGEKAESKEDVKPTFAAAGLLDGREDKVLFSPSVGQTRFGFPSSASSGYSIPDCRSLVKTIICGSKSVAWGIQTCKVPGAAESAPGVSPQNKQFHPKETLVFIRLLKYALQALDIYTISPPIPGQVAPRQIAAVSPVRSKDEKETIEYLAGTFTIMHPLTFREVFSTTIDFFVDRMYKNPALQIMVNSFLAHDTSSHIFATILVEYLLKRMEEMGSSMERSNLYLKLFKMVFGCVSLFAAANEEMLKPYLHQIVNRSMELALSAREPYNYFLLLRALFRSIGGGSHDLLYQEFLPLLPNLLQGLNSLQSGLHKQHMKDLFVELCLTVPVRLSSLLPYLPMLMDPLVSALNGSQTLVSQGLRTLELCVDNLQPEFLYDHIQPVRAELMQALWRTLRNPNDAVAQVAFRVLGKFGGGNRKMMIEPQKLDYCSRESIGPCISVHFQEHKTNISLPIGKVIETACNALKTSSTNEFYRKQCWGVIKGFLSANIELDTDKNNITQLFQHHSFAYGEIPSLQTPYYICPDSESRKVHELALTGMFVASAIKELRPVVLPFMPMIVRHYTMVAVSQQAGPFASATRQPKGMDPLVLVDAIAAIMGHEEKELCKPGGLALVVIIDTATIVLHSKRRACSLPLLEYLAERMCGLCYERAWYAKLGGCHAIKQLLEHCHPIWVYAHLYGFLKALLFVMMDLTGEVSSGAVDYAKTYLETMLRTYCKPCTSEEEDVKEAQTKAINEVVQELVRQLTQPNSCVREQAMHSLRVIAEVGGVSVTAILHPHRDLLSDYVPLRKHVLRHQPVACQVGLLDGNTFCITLEPRLFSYDLTNPDHKTFFDELVTLCEYDDAQLQKLPCYKGLSNLIPIRTAMLRLLAACHYMPDRRRDIFQHLYKALSSSVPELQEVGYNCIRDILGKYEIDVEMVHTTIRPLLMKLGDHRHLCRSVVRHLSYLTLLFPKLFNERLCEQMLAHLRRCMEEAEGATRLNDRTALPNEVGICASIIDIYHQIPAASAKYIEPLLSIVLNTEKNLMMEAGSPYREPLVKFLQRYPSQTIELLLSDANIQDEQVTRFLEYLLKSDQGKPFREVLQQNPAKLVAMTFPGQSASSSSTGQSPPSPHQVQYQAIRIVSLLSKLDDQWLCDQHQLIACLRKIWISKDFQERHLKADTVDYTQWREPKLLAKCLLSFVKHHPSEVELLFQLLRAFTGRFIPDFDFLRDFLEATVAGSYTVDWKRTAFFKFVELFCDDAFPQELKAKILQYVLIPSFASSFERGEGERLIGGPPAPDQDLNENVMSVFINRVIDSDHPFRTSDAVRILLLQFSCLLVEQASPHIHDAANKRQGNKLRRLMTFAWPCLLTKNCVDPATKYHGHLLLANIIAKFAIHKRIVLQVFHSLLKAHAAEARAVVRQALEILTPAMPMRMEDGNNMLTHWTKKIIVEEGHTLAQLVHMLQLLVRHYKVYYPVRHHLISHMVSSVQRLVFTPNATLEHKRLAVDLAEVIVRWEIQRHREEAERLATGIDRNNEVPEPVPAALISLKRNSTDSLDVKRTRNPSGTPAPPKVTDRYKPVDKDHADSVVNFLLRMACQVNESSSTSGTTGELLSRRCVSLLKTALKQDVWPNAEIKLGWSDKLLNTVKETQTSPNIGNICTALELLAFLVSNLRKEAILTTFKPLQRGIAACLSCNHIKVIKSVHNLLTRLMNLFPTEPTNSNVASKYEELEGLYGVVSNVIMEGLTTYEKSPTNAPQTLYSTLMFLKSAILSNPCYIDRLISTFMRVLQKLTKDHLTPPMDDVGTDMLILCLDFVKNRVGVMGSDMRKIYIGSILCSLIERSSDVKVLKAVTKMVEEWVKSKSTIAVNQGPNLKEKSILLVKMMQFVEKRFPNDLDLNAQFLELVHYVYKDESLKGTELTSKLEPAFLAGLRCPQPHIRGKFFEVFDASIRRRLNERILYMACSQNWDLIGPHFWIKQCVELVLVAAVDGPVESAGPAVALPAMTAVVEGAEGAALAMEQLVVKEEPVDGSDNKEDEVDMELGSVPESPSSSGHLNTEALLRKQAKFQEILRGVGTAGLLSATAQLAHLDTQLAAWLWTQLFPRLWRVFSEKQQSHLSSELLAFICSGVHVSQKDCHPDAMGTFLEGVMQCVPPVPLRPSVVRYQGKAHNLWHRACLHLEQVCGERGHLAQARSRSGGDRTEADDTLDALSELYSCLREEDLWGGLWQKRARYEETAAGVALEQQGSFLAALEQYEAAQARMHTEYANTPCPHHFNAEVSMWHQQMLRCYRELNNWDALLHMGHGLQNWNLVIESAWRHQPNWNLMKEAVTHVEANCRREDLWKLHLYKGYLGVCHPEERHLPGVEKGVELCATLCIREWRRLPKIVSHAHLPILQAAQQIIELQDAVQIHQGLLPANIGRAASLHEMKAIVKTWRNRLPVVSDDLSHWSEIFYWRQEHYKAIVSGYEGAQGSGQPPEVQANHAMLGVHASAQSIIHYGKVARKHGLASVCLDALSQIHSIPSVPIVDCFQKIRQQVKCYLQKAHAAGRNDTAETTQALHEGLNVIESTNLKYFTREMTAEFYALRGVFLGQLGRAEEANRVFSAAVQLQDTLVRAWALWGDYMEQLFTREKPESRNMNYGISAITCFLHSCRHQNESKSRKYLAKILWLLTFDDPKGQLSETIEKNFVPVPALQWLPWIPQLLTCLVQTEGRPILNILSHVGRVYPQAVYFPIRTLYLILKIEQREKHKSNSASTATSTPQSPAVSIGDSNSTNEFPPTSSSNSESLPIRATQPMWRCSRIMHMQRDIHPTVLSCLEGIVDQMVWFRENVYEEVLRQLRQALAKCYAVAYENAGAVAEATVTPHTLNFVKKLVSTFGIGVENVSGVSTAISSSASESLARRAQATAQDPVFQRTKGQFTADFDFSVPGAMKLHNLISKLKKWIKILESKTKLRPKSFLIEEKCRFLNNFAQQTADIEIPGEFLLPRHNHYFVRISRFMPKVDIVQKHNTAARRLYIKGHNGKIYPYLVVNDACLSDARREERVLQLLRMLNHYLGKQKETSRRFLNFTVPRVVPVSPQMRLVEDNEASISLLDIYKQRCAKRGIEYDAPLARFYERLATVQARGSNASHQVLRDILKDVQSIMVSKTLLRDWAEQTYPAATDYWTFRKQFTLQLSLCGFIEFVLHLSRLNPDMMYIHQDSGLMNVSYFRFNIEDSKGELEANRPVMFRLTPNIAEFITPVGVSGPMTASMVAAARCLAMPNFKVVSILRAILKDEMTAWYKKRQDDAQSADAKEAEGAIIIQMVNKATNLIMGRLQGLGSTVQVSTLVAVANSHDNLCRMDPAWHPWL